MTGLKRKDISMMMDKTRMMTIKMFKIEFSTIIFKEALEVMVLDQLLVKRKSICISKITNHNSMKIILKDKEEMIMFNKMISFLKRISMLRNKVLRMQKR
jgi:hypothetical protein